MPIDIKFDAFDLQDSNYITEKINYRTIPSRPLVSEPIARKPGRKLVSTDFGVREITLAGWIIADSSSDLIDKMDDLNKNVTRKREGTLEIDTNRQIEAIVSAVTISDPHYTQSVVPFQIEFTCVDPFFRGTQLTASTTVASGVGSAVITTTISGSVFAEPSIVYNAPSGAGDTLTTDIQVEYGPTAETVTWSGGGNALAYSDFVKFDYENQLILEGATDIEPSGVFSRWEPQSTTFTLTFTGNAQGGTIDLIYRPRYL